jgi:predicted transcriptional regulator
MSKKFKLTPVEWEIMEAIWEIGGAPTVREVLEHSFPQGEKAYTTVQTIMNTLEKKQLLTRKKTGLVNFYKPTKSRDVLIRAEMSSLISQVFRGSIPALANSLLSLDGMGLEEIQKIKAMVSEKEKQLKAENHD